MCSMQDLFDALLGACRGSKQTTLKPLKLLTAFPRRRSGKLRANFVWCSYLRCALLREDFKHIVTWPAFFRSSLQFLLLQQCLVQSLCRMSARSAAAHKRAAVQHLESGPA